MFRGLKRNYYRDLSTSICKNQCISLKDALRICINEQNLESFRELYNEELQESINRVLYKEKRKGFEINSAADLDLLYWITEKLKIKNVLETGVASGWSSLALLLAQKNIEDSKLVSIDMPFYNFKNPSNFVGLAVPYKLRKNWVLFREADRIGIPKAFKKNISFGLVHYDSDKTFFGREWALNYIWPRLNKGAIIIIDDIGDNMHFHDFVMKKKLDSIIINSNNKYVGVIKK